MAVVERAQAAGETSYEEAAYDLAIAKLRLGRSLKLGGDTQLAIEPLREARGRLQTLADAGDRSAARMASVAICEAGDCLRDLGRLSQAASAYEEAILRSTRSEDARQVAAIKMQLGTVRALQEQIGEALAAYDEARQTFEQLGESRSVAAILHQIGIVHQRARHYDEAENAYQASLRLEVQNGNRSAEAQTLGQLGNLYDLMDRLEEAGRFYQQAGRVFRELNDIANEGRTCANLADTLMKLGRYDDARRNIQRAIECSTPLGDSAAPWRAYATLAGIERAVGNIADSDAARQRAIDVYLAYRRDGGESLSGGVRIFGLVAEAIANNQIPYAEAQLEKLHGRADLPVYMRALIPKLQAILQGARDPSLANDSDLDYDDAAELELLLDNLAQG